MVVVEVMEIHLLRCCLKVGRNQQSMGAAGPPLQRSSGPGCTSAGSELRRKNTDGTSH